MHPSLNVKILAVLVEQGCVATKAMYMQESSTLHQHLQMLMPLGVYSACAQVPTHCSHQVKCDEHTYVQTQTTLHDYQPYAKGSN